MYPLLQPTAATLRSRSNTYWSYFYKPRQTEISSCLFIGFHWYNTSFVAYLAEKIQECDLDLNPEPYCTGIVQSISLKLGTFSYNSNLEWTLWRLKRIILILSADDFTPHKKFRFRCSDVAQQCKGNLCTCTCRTHARARSRDRYLSRKESSELNLPRKARHIEKILLPSPKSMYLCETLLYQFQNW